MTEPVQPPRPGWYPDPQSPGDNRYWDGQKWTRTTGDPDSAHARRRPFYASVWFWVIFALVVVAALFFWHA